MPVDSLIDVFASSSFWRLRAKIVTRAPSDAECLAKAKPMPLEPPVMKTWRDLSGIVVVRGRVMSLRKSRSVIGMSVIRVRYERLMSAIDG